MFSTSGVFSTSGGYHEYIGRCHDVCGGISCVHRGMFSTSGDTMSTSGGYHEYIRGIPEYIKGISLVHRVS